MSTHSAVPDPRNDSIQIYINGEFFARDDAKISVFDSGYLVGDGVWDGMRFHKGSFIHIERHLDRLFSNAVAIDLDIGMTREEVAAALQATVDRNNMETDVHVRMMITRGDKKTPSQHPANTVGGANIVIIAEHKVASPDVAGGGVKLFTSTVRRPGPDVLDQKLNCHSKLHEVIALIQAMKAGADEALMLDVNGAVATCNATNFFIVRRDEVWTSTGQYCLNGITRALVIELCEANDIPMRQRDFSLTDVYSSDESFVTGTFGGLTPVTEVDGRVIGDGVVPGPMTRRLSTLLREAIEAASHG
jgi:branched-chain amino acid aminotransferase